MEDPGLSTYPALPTRAPGHYLPPGFGLLMVWATKKIVPWKILIKKNPKSYLITVFLKIHMFWIMWENIPANAINTLWIKIWIYKKEFGDKKFRCPGAVETQNRLGDSARVRKPMAVKVKKIPSN
jgi:hypothetical protein